VQRAGGAGGVEKIRRPARDFPGGSRTFCQPATSVSADDWHRCEKKAVHQLRFFGVLLAIFE